MNRRMLLKGVVVGSIASVPNAASAAGGPHGGKTKTDESDATTGDPKHTEPNDAEPNDIDESSLAIRIVDIPDALTGGEFLEWTLEVENLTDESIEPTVDSFVDGESVGSVTLTIGPGETVQPTTPSVPTEPVDTEGSVTPRVSANGVSDERTVRLLPAEELDTALQFPDPELTVQPGTTVHFEVGVVDPDATQTTTWFVDGEEVGSTLADPRQSVYFAEQDAHFWQETFDTPGPSEVVAAVDVDGEQFRASWTVTVDPKGLADPSIDAVRPEPGILEFDSETDEETTLEIDVSDPDENLDRVVWWLTQADTILGVSDVSGATDTASLTVGAELCHTCVIIPWVITGDGTFASEPLWEAVDVNIGEPAGTASPDDQDVGTDDAGDSTAPTPPEADAQSEPSG
ncbi:hypothetical protein [Natronorubrum sediminis]|nr:hypothetical protein [Natronorubrum sediminis]